MKGLPAPASASHPFTRVAQSLSGWAAWWRGLTPLRRWSPLCFVAGYWSILTLLGGLRGDHLTAGIFILGLSYGGSLVEPLLQFLAPLIITGIVFDGQRLLAPWTMGPVHVSEPYDFDKRFFGIWTAQGVLTPNEWWQLHTHPILDLITGAFYMTFIATFVLTAAYFRFGVSKTGTEKRSAEFVRQRSPRVMWSLLWLSLIGFVTARCYPVAPPWYVAQHGLGPADIAAVPDPAGCLRLERLLGIHWFTAYYGREVDVFAAIPSLHVGYPLLAVYFAVQFGAARAFSVVVFLVMSFSAVYLNHHYILDLLVGSAYAVLVAVGMDLLCRRRQPGAGRLASLLRSRVSSA